MTGNVLNKLTDKAGRTEQDLLRQAFDDRLAKHRLLKRRKP